MGSYWWYITVTMGSFDCPQEESEEILNSASEISGCIGSEVQELPNGTRMRIYYRADEDLPYWRNKLMTALEPWPDVKLEDMGKIENQPWSRQSEEAFPPLDVGVTFVVLAPWHKGSEPQDRIPIYINPGSAFGTGYHESTQAALELFENFLARDRKAQNVIDVGTGSGILSIAAAKTGTARICSRDIDPAVMEEARENLELNGIDPSLVTLEIGDLLDGVEDKYDLLFANILLDPLSEMLPDVPKVLRPGGYAIFSGMTERERGNFLDALSRTELVVRDELLKDEWWSVAAENPA